MEKVSDLMSKRSIQTIGPDSSVEQAGRKMKASAKGCLVVIENGKPVGILTERDIVHKVVAEGRSTSTKVAEAMTAPLVTISPRESVAEAARIMSGHRIRHLMVTDGGQALGIITVTDLARHVEPIGVAD
jgi:signal-transduction protein with cAMP-binding, CBS, and nucleotidyltransferase domain